MKILIITHEYPPVGGGSGMAACNMAENLVDLGHRVEVVTSSFGKQEESEFLGGYQVHRVDIGRKRNCGSSVWEMIKFITLGTKTTNKIVKAQKPDYIFAFFTIPAGAIALIMKIKFKIPFLNSLRGQDLPGFCPKEYWLHHFFATPLLKIVWKNSDIITAESKPQYYGLEKLKVKKLLYSPNGVKSEFFKPDPLKRSKDYLTILYSGRLTIQKNISWFIGIFGELAATLPRAIAVKVAIVGDGYEKKKLVDLVRELSLDKYISFYPWCTREEILQWYQKSNIYILPSLDEGMPHSVFEAMSCGLAVVASRVGGTEELITHGENGFLVPPNDRKIFKGYLSQLIIDNDLREKISKCARLRAEQRSWRHVTNEYLSCVASLKSG